MAPELGKKDEGIMQCANLDEHWVCSLCGYTWYGAPSSCPKCNARMDLNVHTIEFVEMVKNLKIWDEKGVRVEGTKTPACKCDQGLVESELWRHNPIKLN